MFDWGFLVGSILFDLIDAISVTVASYSTAAFLLPPANIIRFVVNPTRQQIKQKDYDTPFHLAPPLLALDRSLAGFSAGALVSSLTSTSTLRFSERV